MDETATFIILKFGSIEDALSVWLDTKTRSRFTSDEDKAMAAYAKERWPNLDLRRVVDSLKG